MNVSVTEAALAMVRPSTDQGTRAAASKFLEDFTKTPDAWSTFLAWMKSFDNTGDYECIGTQLLCLQLLQKKIRAEVRRGTDFHAGLLSIQELLGAIGGSATSEPVAFSASICTAALVVRCQAIHQLLSSIDNANRMVMLRVLSQVPPETEACTDLGVTKAANELLPHVEGVLSVLSNELQQSNQSNQQTAAQALLNWTITCRLTISHLSPLIPILVSLFSSPHPPISIAVAKCLGEAMAVVSDSCTETRQTACRMLLENVASMVELSLSTGEDDVAHAIASLCCTMINEEVDNIVEHPATAILPALLRLQSHRVYQIRILVLECWLSIQDIPTADRHADWKASFGNNLLEHLIPSLAYPIDFVGWNDSEIDESSFKEYRSMACDVLISLYVLLRSSYLERMHELIQQQQQHSWTVYEVALFSIVVTSREINARCQTQAPVASITTDRARTIQLLLQSVALMLQQPPALQNELVKDIQAKLIGSYSPTWAVHCSVPEIAQLLQHLQPFMRAGSETAATSFQSLLIQSSKTLTTTKPALALECIHGGWQACLSASPLQILTLNPVAIGSVRLICQLPQAARHLHDLTVPLMQEKVWKAIETIRQHPNGMGIDEAVAFAYNQLLTCLELLQTIIRFSDSSNNANEPPPIGLMLEQQVAPLLTNLTTTTNLEEAGGAVLEGVLGIHEQLLRTAPSLTVASLTETLSWALGTAFQKHRSTRALQLVSSAVETFGSRQLETFQQMVPLVMRLVSDCWNKPDSTAALVSEFFELCRRLFLYCPAAIMISPQQEYLSIGLGTAIEFLQGHIQQQSLERESTRSCLQWVTTVVHASSGSSMPVDAASRAVLDAHRNMITAIVVPLQARLLQICWKVLLEGGMTMLGPPTSECLYAVMRQEAATGNRNNSLNHHHSPVYHNRVAPLLQRLVAQNQKAKAKILVQDYVRIVKGELTEDCLFSYELQ